MIYAYSRWRLRSTTRSGSAVGRGASRRRAAAERRARRCVACDAAAAASRAPGARDPARGARGCGQAAAAHRVPMRERRAPPMRDSAATSASCTSASRARAPPLARRGRRCGVALARGMNAGVRDSAARRLNRAKRNEGRRGARAFVDRYHARVITTPSRGEACARRTSSTTGASTARSARRGWTWPLNRSRRVLCFTAGAGLTHVAGFRPPRGYLALPVAFHGCGC